MGPFFIIIWARNSLIPVNWQPQSVNTRDLWNLLTAASIPLLWNVKSEKIDTDVEERAGGDIGEIMLSSTRFRKGIILHSGQIWVKWLLDGVKRTNSYSICFHLMWQKKKKSWIYTTVLFTWARKSYEFPVPYRWRKA